MSHKETPNVSLSVLFACLIICIAFSVISFYVYKCNSTGERWGHPVTMIATTPSSYIAVKGLNGDTIKVSSKLSGLIAYIANDKNELAMNTCSTNNDKVFWQSKFKSWRDKMTQNDIAPSLNNFMDVVALSKVVKEN